MNSLFYLLNPYVYGLDFDLNEGVKIQDYKSLKSLPFECNKDGVSLDHSNSQI